MGTAIDTSAAEPSIVSVCAFPRGDLNGRRAPSKAARSNPVSRCCGLLAPNGIDEAGTLARLKALQRDLIDPNIAAHSGRIVKLMGDGVLVKFSSAVDAVASAIEIQKHVREHDAGRSEANPIQFRVGINVGDIIIEGDDIFGDGVNIAARIESVAAPGGISLSEDAWRQVQGKVAANFVDSGEQSLKNIARPARVYRVELGWEGTTLPTAPASAPPANPRSRCCRLRT